MVWHSESAGPTCGEVVEKGRAAVTHDADRRLAYEAARAVGLALAGHPIDCLQVAAGVRHMAETAEMGTLRVELDIAEAIAARELGDRERAEPALEALAARSAYPNTYVQLLAMLELVELRLGDGDLAAAESLFHQVEELVRRELDGADGRGRLARTGVLLSLGRGRPRRRPALDASDRRPVLAADLRGQGPSRCRAATRCRRGRRTGQNRVAPGTGSCASCCWAGRSRDVDREAAAKSVATAVDLAAENGMLQTVAADGEAVLELIELAAWRVPGAWMDRLRRALPSDLDAGRRPPGWSRA